MSLAPTFGGFTAHYSSWRWTQYTLAIAGAASFLLTLLVLPETSQPGARGVDKLIQKEGKSRWVWLNPFRSIGLLRSPNVSLIVSTEDVFTTLQLSDPSLQSLAQGLVVITDYGMCTLVTNPPQLVDSLDSTSCPYRLYVRCQVSHHQ